MLFADGRAVEIPVFERDRFLPGLAVCEGFSGTDSKESLHGAGVGKPCRDKSRIAQRVGLRELVNPSRCF
jgi:hypothetical protein